MHGEVNGEARQGARQGARHGHGHGMGPACVWLCMVAWARRVPAGARICSLPESTSQQLQPGAPSRHSVAYLVRDGDGDR